METTTNGLAGLDRRCRLVRIAATIAGILVVGCLTLVDATNGAQFPDPVFLLLGLACIGGLGYLHWYYAGISRVIRTVTPRPGHTMPSGRCAETRAGQGFSHM